LSDRQPCTSEQVSANESGESLPCSGAGPISPSDALATVIVYYIRNHLLLPKDVENTANELVNILANPDLIYE